MKRFLPVLFLALVAGCSSKPPADPVAVMPRLEARLDRAENLSNAPLNVSIAVFADGVVDAQRAVLPVREAETLYLPVALKATLNESGYWGAVRVVPEPDPGAELTVTGSIILSDGVQLALRIHAFDSTGRTWLQRTYEDNATDHGYGFEATAYQEPFQDLFNQVANDLTAIYQQLDERGVKTILDAATLRYANALSPDRFAEFLVTDSEGLLQINRLPARADTMYQRVNRIRESENRFIDTVDEQYEGIYQRMQEPYAYWRRYAYELIQYNREIAGSDRARRDADSYEGMAAIYRQYQDSRLNEDELREMAASFDAEITPTITRLEGRVIELQGSLLHQYEAWRELLQALYQLENQEG